MALENGRKHDARLSRAVRSGFEYVETDVHATADGVLVVFSDDRLDRVTNKAGKVSELSWAK